MHPTSLSLSVYQPGHSDTFLQLYAELGPQFLEMSLTIADSKDQSWQFLLAQVVAW